MSSCQPAVELVQAADPAAPLQGKTVLHVEEKLGEVVHSVCDVGMPDVRTEETRTGDHQQPGACASSTSSGTVAEHNNSLGSKVNQLSTRYRILAPVPIYRFVLLLVLVL